MTTSNDSDDQIPTDQLLNKFSKPVVVFNATDDIEPIVIDANPAFHDVFTPSDSVSGQSLTNLIVPDECTSEAQKFVADIRNGESNTSIIERATTDGRRKFFYHSIPLAENRGLAIYSDVTEKIQEKYKLEVLQQAFHTKICEELGNIISEVNTILHTDQNEDIKNSIEEIKQATDEFKRLCLEAHTAREVIIGSSHLETIDIKPILNSVSKDCLRRFKQVRITTDCPQDTLVWADSRLRLVVDNLVDNAIRHNNKALPKVTISVDIIGDDVVEIQVVDNGPGIPKSVQELSSGSVSPATVSRSNDLGLLLVKWVVDSYGAELTLKTLQDGGSLARVRLQRA